MSASTILLFADFTCPFSYVTETALERLLSGRRTKIDHRAYELYPVPAPLPDERAAGEWDEAIQSLAEQIGICIRHNTRTPRTRKAHEAARYARDQGREPLMRAVIYRAFWEEARDIGRIDVLESLAAEAGLDAQGLKISLDIDKFTDAVLQDQLVADRSGIRQTPTLIVDALPEPRIVVGAQSLADLRGLLAEIDA